MTVLCLTRDCKICINVSRIWNMFQKRHINISLRKKSDSILSQTYAFWRLVRVICLQRTWLTHNIDWICTILKSCEYIISKYSGKQKIPVQNNRHWWFWILKLNWLIDKHLLNEISYSVRILQHLLTNYILMLVFQFSYNKKVDNATT